MEENRDKFADSNSRDDGTELLNFGSRDIRSPPTHKNYVKKGDQNKKVQNYDKKAFEEKWEEVKMPAARSSSVNVGNGFQFATIKEDDPRYVTTI